MAPSPSMATAAVRLALGLLLVSAFATRANVFANGASNAGALGTPVTGPKCRNAFPARALCKFVDDLATTMRVAVDTSDGKLVRIGVYQIYQKFHRDLPPTKLYAYGLNQKTAAFPGPTIVARKGKDTQIFWSNHIMDRQHMIQLDDTLMIPRPKKGGVPIVPHRHGGETHSIYDGHPQAWFTQFGEKGPAYSTRLYHYHNNQKPSIVWYHDHAIAITRINVMAGMAGLYLVTDPQGEEREINKWVPQPGGPFFMPLAIADRRFHPNGSLDYPTDGILPREHPHWQPEFFGDTITVNGRVWPYMKVRRALYRLPILGASNARFYHLRFQCAVRGDYHEFKPPFRGPIIPMTQIGSDGGYLARPLRMPGVLVAPGERLDVLVDFNEAPSWCRDVLLTNRARTPFPAGERVSPDTAVIMRFILTKKTAIPSPPIPKALRPLERIPFNLVSTTRWHVLGEISDRDSGFPTVVQLDGLGFLDRPTEILKNGAVEVWHLINPTADSHPIHLHLMQHRPFARRPFNSDAFLSGDCTLPVNLPSTSSSPGSGGSMSSSGGSSTMSSNGSSDVSTMSSDVSIMSAGEGGYPSCFTGRARRVDFNEMGWKDTTKAHPGEVLSILVAVRSQDGKPFSFDPSQGPGYVWHCHILEHEDNDMMRPLLVRK
ncbi:hypothetical protein CLOM_g3508 [Closterium sp. NIES-68]|nr:hypothetical protein CLOM_g3508 [Closterium sp. NIES-68]GJP75241.1 hypothetical protein CLOP_g5699 [Closterium sp. NIES-67]